MKYIRTIMILATASIAMLGAACGNASAKNDENKKEKTATENTIKAKELTAEEFNKMVYDLSKEELKYLGDKPAIVDFTAKWCGPCQRISPILDQLAKEYDGKVAVYKVDIDKNQELAKFFGVRSIPAILYIPMDNEPSMTVGSRDKARFINEINTILLGE